MNEVQRDELLLNSALAGARDTRVCVVGPGVLARAGELFRHQFRTASAMIVSDVNIFAVAGRQLSDSLINQGIACEAPFVIDDPNLFAEDTYTQQVFAAVSRTDAIPVALGAGTINDLVKLVAHRLGRQYLCVASAASMDGYTAFGSSITKDGLKQTFDCPAPVAVLADTEIIAAAPSHLNAAGYGDLAAKLTAGADWLAADALAIEPVDGPSWGFVQDRLRFWLDDPAGVKAGNAEAIRKLILGLMMGGFAMQRTKTSRPASGAEHQFSHLWDMQNHKHEGSSPAHGFKVAIGTLAMTRWYENMIHHSMNDLDIESAVRHWPSKESALQNAESSFDSTALKECALRETGVKYVSSQELNHQLRLLQSKWPVLKSRLQDHLMPSEELADRLTAVGAPTRSDEIGIPPERLKTSHRLAYYIRRRFTGLDLAERTGLFHVTLRRSCE